MYSLRCFSFSSEHGRQTVVYTRLQEGRELIQTTSSAYWFVSLFVFHKERERGRGGGRETVLGRVSLEFFKTLQIFRGTATCDGCFGLSGGNHLTSSSSTAGIDRTHGLSAPSACWKMEDPIEKRNPKFISLQFSLDHKETNPTTGTIHTYLKPSRLCLQMYRYASPLFGTPSLIEIFLECFRNVQRGGF